MHVQGVGPLVELAITRTLWPTSKVCFLLASAPAERAP